jgi:hypothetical protein
LVEAAGVEVAGDDGMACFKTHGHGEHHVMRLHKSDANHVELIAMPGVSCPMAIGPGTIEVQNPITFEPIAR